jgi:hypothetical protein
MGCDVITEKPVKTGKLVVVDDLFLLPFQPL